MNENDRGTEIQVDIHPLLVVVLPRHPELVLKKDDFLSSHNTI